MSVCPRVKRSCDLAGSVSVGHVYEMWASGTLAYKNTLTKLLRRSPESSYDKSGVALRRT